MLWDAFIVSIFRLAAGLFTANPDFADMLGVSWQERHRLYNGPLKCRLLTTASPGSFEEPDEGIRLSLQEVHQESDPTLPAQDFADRLRKNCQRLFPWAEEHNITCFRIYDADILEYNIAIDVYEQWVHVQEYEPPATVASEKAEERFNQALQVIRQLLDVPHSQLFVKKRRKQRGMSSIRSVLTQRVKQVERPVRRGNCMRCAKEETVFW